MLTSLGSWRVRIIWLHFWWGHWGPTLSNLFKVTQVIKERTELSSGLSLFFMPITHSYYCALEYPPCNNLSVLSGGPPKCFLDMVKVLHLADSLGPADIWPGAKHLGWSTHSLSLTVPQAVGTKIFPAAYCCVWTLLHSLSWFASLRYMVLTPTKFCSATNILRPPLQPLRTSLCLLWVIEHSAHKLL